MSRRLTIITVIALMILLSLTLAACEKERPVPTPSRSTPQTARGTVAVTTGTPSTPSAALTQGTAAAGSGTRTVLATPIPVGGSTSTTATAPQPVVVSTNVASGATSTYTVQAGDTLGKIALRYGTTVAALLKLNGLSNPDVLAIGQKLKVPGTGGGAPAAVGTPKPATGGQGKTYVVQKGDTLLSIARRYGLTTKQLQAANNITNPDKIFPGQKLVIP